MSYILDALKRADAERERGQVPGLHSQAAAVQEDRHALPKQPRPGPISRKVLWAVLGLALAGALLVTLWPRRETPAPIAMTAPEVPPTAAVTMPPPPPAPLLSAPATPAPPILVPPPPAQPSVAPAATQPATGTTQKSVGAVQRFANLSTEQRAQLPQLTINGASYSENPAHRLLIVNGQVAHEGQEVAPGLVLERIGLNEAVLNQRGLRFSIGY